MRYEVIRHVTFEYRYVVDAADPKAAEAKTSDLSPETEEELCSETMAIREQSSEGHTE